MASPDSSMDESLQDFLDREGIKIDRIAPAESISTPKETASEDELILKKPLSSN